jgi:hypothetical protein
MAYIVEFHLSPDAVNLDPDLAAPERIGPFDSVDEAKAFGKAHLRFYHSFAVIDPEDDLFTPEQWIAQEKED